MWLLFEFYLSTDIDNITMLPENVNRNAVLQSITDTWLPLIGVAAAVILVSIIAHVIQKNKK